MAIDPATRKSLATIGAACERFAGIIAPHVGLTSIRARHVKEKTRAVLQYMVDNILIPNPNKIRRMLDPSLKEENPIPDFPELPPGVTLSPGGTPDAMPGSPPNGPGAGMTNPLLPPNF